MNLKERIIEKLLGVAKKHKLLTYPALALVAIISVIGYFFSWSTGAGKRVVALIMVMVMLVSQSYFLTSSATELIDTEETLVFQQQLQADDKESAQEAKEDKSSDEQAEPAQETTDITESSDNADTIEEDTMNDVVNSTEGTSESDASVAGPDTTDWGIEEEEIESNTDPNYVEVVVTSDSTGNEGGTSTGGYQATFYFEPNSDGTTCNLGKAGKDGKTLTSILSQFQASESVGVGGCYNVLNKWYADNNYNNEYTDMSNVPISSDGRVHLYLKRVLTKYDITNKRNCDSDDPCSFTFGGTPVALGTDEYATQVNVDTDESGNISANISLSSIYRHGYKLTNASESTSASAVVNFNESTKEATANITITGNTPKHTITFVWDGLSYDIIYDHDGVADGETTTDHPKYGAGNYTVASNIIADNKVGKKVKDEWLVGQTTNTVTKGQLLDNYPAIRKTLYDASVSGSPLTLYPQYDDDDIVLVDGQQTNFVKTYKKYDSEPTQIKAQFEHSSYADSANSGKLAYSCDSSEINKVKAYGINVIVQPANGVYVQYLAKDDTNGLGNKVGSTSLKITVTNSDNSSSEDFTINFTINNKAIKLKGLAYTTKPYDAKTTVNANFPLTYEVEGEPTLTVSCDGAHYQDADVGDNKVIELINPVIKVNGDASDPEAQKYTCPQEVTGSITPRPVWVVTSADKTSVKAGEKNPDFSVTEDKSSAHHNDVYGILAEDEGKDLKTVLNLTLSTNRPTATSDDYEKAGTYLVKATAGASNYDVNITEGSFTVTKEKPHLDTNYYFDAGSKTDDYYTAADATIKAQNGYDTVEVSTDGGATWETGAIGAGLPIKEEYSEYSKNGTLKIRLRNLSGKGTDDNGVEYPGAITDVGSLTVKYDITAPNYVGYSIDEVAYSSSTSPTPGLYFAGAGSVLDFGTYIKKQVTINIKFEDTTSGVNKLYYGLFGNSINDSNPVLFDQTTGVATISVLRDALTAADKDRTGVIKFRAVDTAGNQSADYILRPDGNTKDDYEWSVEEEGPTVGGLAIYYGENKDKIVGAAGRYYNHCEARVSVSDTVSGLERIEWYVNDTLFRTDEIHGDSKTISNMESDGITPKAYTCSLLGSELVAKGINTNNVSVYAVVYDNAGNEKATQKSVEFKIDDVAPEYETSFDENTWTNNTNIDVLVWDDLSDIKYASVTGPDGVTDNLKYEKQTGNKYTVSINATTKGSYTLELSDNAENITRKTWNIQKISTTVPDCPNKYITFAPEEPNGLDGWYKKGDIVPSVTIKNIKSVDEGAGVTPTDVTTSYRIWKEGESSFKYNKNDISSTKDSEKISLSDDGVWYINAWAKSISNVYCHTNCEDNDHSDIKTIKIDCTEPKIDFYTEKGSNSSVIVNFTVTDATSGVNSKTIEVMHGNQKLDATIEAISNGYKGSFVIDEVGDYSIQAADNAGNASDKTAFTPMSMKIKAITNLTDNTATVGANIIKGTFDIKSTAVAYKKVSDEEYTEADSAEVVTTDGKAVSAVLSGLSPATSYAYKITAVSDANEVLEYEGYFRTVSDSQAGISVVGMARYDDGSDGSITVGIFEGGICIMAKEVAAGSEFTFDNLPDGNYNIVATDGTYSKNMRLLIDNGMIVYPLHYIDLVLSGKNTSVVITTSDTPNVTADGMDTIFTDDYINFTADDRKLIDNNGTVEFRLYATLMPKTSVSSEEISAMYAVTDSNKVVAAYLDLSLYKIVTDPAGNVTQSKVTNLANPAHISVTIPLGSIAGKPGLQVVRIHNDGENFLGSVLVDEDSNPNTYTISTNQFSTYAVLYTVNNEEATTQQSTVQQDTGVITPIIPDSGKETPVTITPKPSTDDDDDEDVSEIKDKSKKPKDSSTASTVGSLTSSGYAKTGDATPIVMLFAIMTMSCAAFIVLRKKMKE
jgi:hypothetical protein